MDTWSLAAANLTSPPVLAFILGLLATALGGDLRLPEPVYQLLSFYLLLGIGIKGGVALSEAPAGEVLLPVLVTLALGVVIPLLAFVVLRFMTQLGPVDRGALAAHYGSTSLVTFTAAIVFLTSADIAYEGFVTTLLAVLEVPAIVVGLMLAGRHAARSASWGESLREILTSRSVLLLVGGLVLGFVTGTAGYAKVEPFFGGLFTGVLTLFLLEMGVIAARRLRDLPTAGIGLGLFALGFPVVAGVLGIVGGLAAGLSTGGAAVLGVLAASASYIAAPAAVRLALPEANPGYYLTASLGITFPFNLIVGIPLYLAIAQALGG
ncbi:MAG TPA: sodium-dependent bicarbonate transport family permease [Candidatus Nanopelagicales bacterium]